MEQYDQQLVTVPLLRFAQVEKAKYFTLLPKYLTK